ncbi:WD40/YVTN/BNR-like repeat-containing protein [Zavarzinia aquatilis]|uniref:Photosystem II stability/assembly factor-like protein n=1 Tax=Zavarzinia aquatilis TaxID=2211142 RepID=A0A317EEA5_9PROT|nr:photosystem II stability/assembly factor-like protein [Zavarzinia aquatilis]PWR25249.1 photosystem II stability/assembly factor-like protein [Zavarzinia aquatilis]
MRIRGHLALALTLSLAGLAPAGASAGTIGFDVLNQGTAHEALYCLSRDNDRMVAVGAPNLIFDSADGGATWKRDATASFTGAPFGCQLKDGMGLIVGQQGLILWQDGGTWSVVPKVSDARLFSVDMNAAGLAVAVGGFGTILISTDAGRSWAPVSYDWSTTNTEGFEPHVYAVSVSEDGTIVATAEFESILRSTDQGKTWALVHKGTASLFDIAIGEDGIGYAVGQEGRVLRTADKGVSWSVVDTNVTTNLLGVRRNGAGKVLVTGLRSLLVGADDGSALAPIAPGDIATGWYQGIARGGNGAWLLGGQAGRVVRVTAE